MWSQRRNAARIRRAHGLGALRLHTARGYANLVKLASPYYNAQHQFYVNGSPQASDVQYSDNTWHTVLVGVQAQGGNSVYALDVTYPNTLTSEAALASAVLWEYTDSDMGYGFSTPALAPTAAGWTVFVGNGYNSTNQKPVLYAINPQTGATMRKLDLCASLVTNVCNMSASNGLSSVIAVNTRRPGFRECERRVRRRFAGQPVARRHQQCESQPMDGDGAVPGEGFGPRKPSAITTAPIASLNPNYPQALGSMVYFVTGQLLGTPDLSTTQLQTAYGIYDPQTDSRRRWPAHGALESGRVLPLRARDSLSRRYRSLPPTQTRWSSAPTPPRSPRTRAGGWI